jgi:hypothetical protein
MHRNTQIQYKQTVHAHKCLHCAGFEPATSCVVGEYSHHYATSAVDACLHFSILTLLNFRDRAPKRTDRGAIKVLMVSLIDMSA